MVPALERVLRVCNGFLCSMSVTYDGAVLLMIIIIIIMVIFKCYFSGELIALS